MTPSCCSRRTGLRQCRKNTTMNRSAAEQDLTQGAQRTQSSQRRRGNDMRVRGKFGTMMIASMLAAAGTARAQEMQMPKQEQHQHMEIPPVKPEYPRMGRAQEHAQGALVTLEQARKSARPGRVNNSRGSIRIQRPATRAMRFAAARSAGESRASSCSKR